MSTSVLRLAGGAELSLAATPQQVTVFADGQSRGGYLIKVTADDAHSAEGVNALVSDPAKTATWDIVNDGIVAGSYSNYAVLANGVTLESGALSLTLCKRTEIEIGLAAQAAATAAQADAIAELSILVAGGNA